MAKLIKSPNNSSIVQQSSSSLVKPELIPSSLPIKQEAQSQPKVVHQKLTQYGLLTLATVGLSIPFGYLGAGLGVSFMLSQGLKKTSIQAIAVCTILATAMGLHFAPKSTLGFTTGGATVGTFAAWRKRERREHEVLEGTEVCHTQQQQKVFDRQQRKRLRQNPPQVEELRFVIGGQQLPSELNHLNFFCLGAPGSGKSQALYGILEQLRRCPHWRVVILDRNGEFMRYFYAQDYDWLNNPLDCRSLQWSHIGEGVSLETIARALIPDGISDEPIWAVASRTFHRAILERTSNNKQVWEALTRYSLNQLRDLMVGTPAMRYFGDGKMATNVTAAYVDRCRFYECLPEANNPFSFFGWGARDEPRWLWMPIFEEQEEILRPYMTMAMELVIRGLLTNDNRNIKTAIVIDELAALDEIPSLRHLLAQGRKFQTSCFLATQALAQVREIYGGQMQSILLQTTKTKLILNCPDPDSASIMADSIGRQVRLEAPWTNSISRQVEMLHAREFRLMPSVLAKGMVGLAENLEVLFPRQIPPRQEWQRIEAHAVPPSVIQHLPSLEGYLLVSNGTPVARVKIPICRYQPVASVFEPRSATAWLEAEG